MLRVRNGGADLNSSKNHPQECQGKAGSGKVIITIRRQPNTDDDGDQGQVGLGGIRPFVPQAIDQDGKDRACRPHDLVEWY